MLMPLIIWWWSSETIAHQYTHDGAHCADVSFRYRHIHWTTANDKNQMVGTFNKLISRRMKKGIIRKQIPKLHAHTWCACAVSKIAPRWSRNVAFACPLFHSSRVLNVMKEFVSFFKRKSTLFFFFFFVVVASTRIIITVITTTHQQTHTRVSRRHANSNLWAFSHRHPRATNTVLG